jgi:hypothetical protein
MLAKRVAAEGLAPHVHKQPVRAEGWMTRRFNLPNRSASVCDDDVLHIGPLANLFEFDREPRHGERLVAYGRAGDVPIQCSHD